LLALVGELRARRAGQRIAPVELVVVALVVGLGHVVPA
jgi:hypothetical protein